MIHPCSLCCLLSVLVRKGRELTLSAWMAVKRSGCGNVTAHRSRIPTTKAKHRRMSEGNMG